MMALGQQAIAQTSPDDTTLPEEGRAQPPQPRIEVGVPEGFEALDEDVSTLFDVYVLNRRIGAFRAILSRGTIRFIEPEMIAAALAGIIEREAVLSLLSQSLPANEQLRCLPGQTFNCGLLPLGQSGVIVDAQQFSVEMFFATASVILAEQKVLTLGPSSSTGPSLVQNIAVAAATSGGANSNVSYGATLDTYASVGQSAFIAQTLIRDDAGSEINQALVQHVWNERIAKAGLFEDFSHSLLTNYRMFGAEFGSFYPRMAYGSESATPIQIVLPRDADVEIRRNGVLISVRRYGAGPQLVDTSALPTGSYPISIIARAEGQVVLDEVRSFSRSGFLPPPGKTEFSIRAGVYADNRFRNLLTPSDTLPFFPRLDSKPLVGAFVSRRLAPATGGSLGVLSISGNNYAEASLSTVWLGVEGFASAAVGDDGSYGFLLNGGTTIANIRFTLSGRWVEPGRDIFDPNFPRDEYLPFARSERSILGSMQFNLLGGSAAVMASYTSSERIQDRYSVDVRYSRPITIADKPAILSLFGRVADNDTRIGFTLSSYFGINSKTRASVTAGAEYVPRTDGNTREGLSPIVNATISRRETMPGLDIVAQGGVSTDAGSDRAFVGANLASSYGIADVTAQYLRSRGGFDSTSVFGNLQTGFAIGGGRAKFGLAQLGEAVILSDLAIDAPTRAGLGDARRSGYRAQINTQAFDLLRPGRVSAAGLPAYEEYEVTLVPENAPPYEVDIRRRNVTLYPGNVVRMRYEALRTFTLFGQLVDDDGAPLDGWVVRTDEDLTQTSGGGYFTVTAPSKSDLTIRSVEGESCLSVPVESLIDTRSYAEVYRIDKIKCKGGPSE